MRNLAALAGVGLLLLGPAGARADAPAPAPAMSPVPGAFTPAQRAEIVAIVREALKTDPTILRDAVDALRTADAKTQATDQANAAAAHHAELLTGDAVAGNPSGDVTLTEFYDPRCPYCKKMVPTIDAAIRGDRHLRVVFRLIPILGADSVVEARAILAAGMQGRYVAMEEQLMGSGAPATDANIAIAARAVGADPKRLAADMASPAITRRLRDNLALATALGAQGTPTIVIGGAVFPGMVELPDLKQAITQARS